ncbi:hypothetical protein BF49_4642 [Bradyrhizobium sp.]|uniref:hypothetical protein n=1 Tax=Bradyrhizobium sp. TaxID=376 RepID=UPI0007C1CB4F|nr:hypothetical protein [Bradyrhizobium sp.]CUT13562.1 hypothetical protein BF49_4642 [Bradyrhizobium sp.]
MSSDSHTDFNSGGFTAGAVGGAMTLAGALVAGMQNAAQLNSQRWAGWERGELVHALNIAESLKNRFRDENAELRAANEQLRRVIRLMTVRPAFPKR